MKTLLHVVILSLLSTSCYSQSRLILGLDKYPDDLQNAVLISVKEVQQLTETQILNALPDTDFYLDSAIRESLKCIALYRFKMNFFRKGEKGILDVDSDFNKISFEMRLILKNALPGDVVQFDYVQCVRTDYEYRKRIGVFFKVTE